MKTSNDLMNRINEKYSRLSKGQRLLATYITDNYDTAAFLTAASLGKTVGVSESTVVRFATQLGYKGYPEFQGAIQELVRDKLSMAQTEEVTFERINREEVLDFILGADMDNIRSTMDNVDHSAFDQAVETILNARKIYVIGLRSCAPLAEFLSFYLNMIFPDVVQLKTNSASELFEQTLHISENDVMIGISFPRYSMRTLKMLEFANNRNAKVITLTDSVHSPMNLYSSCNLLARSTLASAVESLTAPLSVINALIVALFMRKKRDLVKTLEDLENIWDEYQVYDNDEMGYIGDSVKMNYPAKDVDNE